MSALEILTLSTTAGGVTDVTWSIQSVLNRWDSEDLLPGDALCCVTMATAGAGLLVSDHSPDVSFQFGGSLGGFGFSLDLSRMRRLFARTSETFLVRGKTILGSRRIYVLADAGVGRCEVALTIL